MRLSEATISVIIPALDEARQIGERVSELRGVAGVEVIVSDGGSADGTRDLALAAGARVCLPCTNGTKQSNDTYVQNGDSYSCNSSLRVISAPRGRARQMNCGAAAARGEILLFLHADTRLPAGFAEDVRGALAREDVAAGAFELAIEGADWRLRAVARLANERARRLHMPYGDQALFLTARVFRESGGFPEIALMEDFEYVRRLKRRGRIVIVPRAVRTSARRWRKRGVLRQTLLNQGLIGARLLGVSPDKLAEWYG
jgi:rSAM/selenodomain-associated transferase 2